MHNIKIVGRTIFEFMSRYVQYLYTEIVVILSEFERKGSNTSTLHIIKIRRY